MKWVFIWNTLLSKHRKKQTYKCWKGKWCLTKS